MAASILHSMGLSGAFPAKYMLSAHFGISHRRIFARAHSPLAVLVIESRDRIGGRLHSVFGADVGGSWLWDGEERAELLARRFGLG